MAAFFALIPIALFMILLVGLRWTAAFAGLAAAGLAAVVSITAFDYAASAANFIGPALEAAFTSASILWIILPALGIYEYQERTGGTG